MPQSTNYIKTKSLKDVRDQNRASEREAVGAGSNDEDNFPGSNGQHSPKRDNQDVHQPESLTFVQDRTESYSIRTGQMGGGNVGSPSEIDSKPMIESYRFPSYPFTESVVDRSKVQDEGDRSFSRVEAGTLESSPGGNHQAGSISKELERTTSRDGERTKRTLARHRRIIEKDNLR